MSLSTASYHNDCHHRFSAILFLSELVFEDASNNKYAMTRNWSNQNQIRPQIPPSKPKREITKMTNSQITKTKYKDIIYTCICSLCILTYCNLSYFPF